MELNLKQKMATLFDLVSANERQNNPALHRQSKKLFELVTRYRANDPKKLDDESGFSVLVPLQDKVRSRRKTQVTEAIYGMVIALILGGCEAPSTPEPQPVAPKPTATGTALAEDEPNHYSVVIHWPAATTPEKWALHRRGSGDPLSLTQVAMLSGDQNAFEDTGVQAGETYTYFVSAIGGEHFKLTEKIQVEVPKDLVIAGVRRDVHDVQGFNRLYLKEGAVLITGTEGLVVRVNEIHSASGIIETFQREERSRAPARGLNAGPVSLYAQKAVGTLGLVSIGQSGGHGVNGLAGAAGAAGMNGVDGEWGANPELFARGYSKEHIEASVTRMRAKNPPPSDHNWKNVFGFDNLPNFACISPPTNGAPGETGGQGLPGGNGSDGGNSARVYIEIKDGSSFVVDETVEGGAPGSPGEGGPGGNGGRGGDPGKIDRGCLCPRAKPGVRGSQGPKGQSGLSGRPGLKEPFCLNVNGVRSEGCTHFTNEGSK